MGARREKQTTVSSFPALGFGPGDGTLYQTDVGNLRKEDLLPQCTCKAVDTLSGFLWLTCLPRDGHMEVKCEPQAGEAEGSLGVFGFPALPGSYVMRTRPGSPCGFTGWDSEGSCVEIELIHHGPWVVRAA